jgi:uncharacterized membrane protein HdeD (DUF308 family)
MLDQLARGWWIVALRGLLGIVFGILAFVWPGITLLALVLVFGAYIFVDGVVALVQAVRFRHERERWPMLFLEGILGIAFGIVSFALPGITALAWLYTIAFWAIVTGILEIVFAIELRKLIKGEIFVGLTGVASIVLGIALIVMPLAGLLAWVLVIGAYAIASGVLLIALGLRLRKLSSHAPTGLSASGV